MKARFALLIALALGILAALAVRQYVQQEKISFFEGKIPVSILVAAREVQEGEALTPSLLKTKEFPSEFLPAGDTITINDQGKVVGKKVNRKIKRDEALQWADLVDKEKAEEQGLQARLTVGERAFTTSVDKISGVGGMIRPGDRIDLYVTFRLSDPASPNGQRIDTYPILQSVLVLATDQNLGSREVPDHLRRAGAKEGYSSLTLNVTSAEVGLLIYAQEAGTLRAVLRNRQDLLPVNDEKVTSKNFPDLSDAASKRRADEINKMVEVDDVMKKKDE